MSERLEDASSFEFLEFLLPGGEVNTRERIDNPARDAAHGREMRTAVFLARQGAETILVREAMEGKEARLVFEPNEVAWLEHPDASSLEQAETALRQHAEPAESTPA